MTILDFQVKFRAFKRRTLKCTVIAKCLVLPESPFTVPSCEMNYLPLQLQLTLNRLPYQSLLCLREGESRMLITRRYRREVMWLGGQGQMVTWYKITIREEKSILVSVVWQGDYG